MVIGNKYDYRKVWRRFKMVVDRLIDISIRLYMRIMNGFFPHKSVPKFTWYRLVV